MDSICCSICADEPIAYALKNINGKENMEFLQEKYINNNNDEDSSNSSEIKSKIENLQTKDANKRQYKTPAYCTGVCFFVHASAIVLAAISRSTESAATFSSSRI